MILTIRSSGERGMRGLLLVGLVVLGTTVSAGAAPLDTSAWLKNYETAKATAARSGRPMLVVFR
jgi:hypothetical protein